MKIGIGKAHGKIILIGEHAVVYGKKAIAIPFFKTTVTTKVFESVDAYITSTVYSGKLKDAPSDIESITSLINELTNKLNIPSLQYLIDSNIPISAGMGSSAAIASSIVEAVYDYLDLELKDQTRFEWVQFGERIAHGNPSGIDALTTTHDNALLFQKGNPPIPFSSKINGYLIVGQSGQMGNTKEAVSAVRRLVNEENKMYLIDEIATLVDICYDAYLKQNIELVGNTLLNTQRKLKELDVSTQIIDDMVDIALHNGALGAKLTGGGRGGCVIAITRTEEDADRIKTKWEEYNNKQAWILNLNEE